MQRRRDKVDGKIWANEIYPSVFLGSGQDASNLEQLRKHGITHIINVANDVPNYHEGDEGLTYCSLMVGDFGLCFEIWTCISRGTLARSHLHLALIQPHLRQSSGTDMKRTTVTARSSTAHSSTAAQWHRAREQQLVRSLPHVDCCSPTSTHMHTFFPFLPRASTSPKSTTHDTPDSLACTAQYFAACFELIRERQRDLKSLRASERIRQWSHRNESGEGRRPAPRREGAGALC
jgi:hypothetical protein